MARILVSCPKNVPHWAWLQQPKFIVWQPGGQTVRMEASQGRLLARLWEIPLLWPRWSVACRGCSPVPPHCLPSSVSVSVSDFPSEGQRSGLPSPALHHPRRPYLQVSHTHRPHREAAHLQSRAPESRAQISLGPGESSSLLTFLRSKRTVCSCTRTRFAPEKPCHGLLSLSSHRARAAGHTDSRSAPSGSGWKYPAETPFWLQGGLLSARPALRTETSTAHGNGISC